MPLPTPQQKIRSEYRIISQLIDEVKQNGNEEMQQLVEKWRREVVLLFAQTDKLDPLAVESLKAQLQQVSDAVHEQLYKTLTDNQRRLFIKGIQTVDRILKSGDVRAAVPYLNDIKLELLQRYSAEHITGITDLARKNISTEIDLAVLGQKPVSDIISAIGRDLNGPSVFGNISRRARVIYQTETNRIHNIAAADRMKQLVGQVPDLKKQWLHHHIGVPRAGHLALNFDTIGVTARYKLIGADGTIYEIDEPQDPSLPVSEVVNCHCTIRPVVGRFEEK